jgi:hypothetical protein
MPIVHVRSVLASFAAPLALVLVACGGGTPSPTDPTSTSSTHDTAAASAGGSALLTPAGTAGSTKAERRTSASWAPCHQSYKVDTSADLATSVDQMAKGCADTTRMHLVDSFKGSQGAANAPQAFHFKADANHCYRAYAVAAPTITDLDLLMKDGTGALAGEDSTDDPTPVVLEDGAVCWKSADDATVVVSIGAGNGAYAVEVWGD